MVVTIVAGKGGSGKTSQVATLARIFSPSSWAIMEKKDERAICAMKEIQSKAIFAIDTAYIINPVQILVNFQEWRDNTLTSVQTDAPVNWKTIVVDGISDLRDYAISEWIQVHPIIDKRTHEKTSRKSIGVDNLSAWEEINRRVRLLLEPLINYCLYHNVHLFMTAQMKPTYERNTRIGEEIDIKEWIEYPCECILILKVHNTSPRKYTVECIKSPLWSKGSGWTEELQKDTGLLEVLSAYQLL